MMDPRYPVGKFERPTAITAESRVAWLADLEQLPAKLSAAVEGLSEAQIDTPYREGGWTVRQLVHHVADSHINSYLRCKFAAAEENPTIMPYDEGVWANFEDASREDVATSLDLIRALHRRWVRFLRSLDEGGYARTMVHPENGPMTLNLVMALYSWHGRHHVAHVTELRRRMGW